METVTIQRKPKNISTLETQEEMYKRRLEQRQFNQGLTVQEILDKVNDPTKFTSRSRQ